MAQKEPFSKVEGIANLREDETNISPQTTSELRAYQQTLLEDQENALENLSTVVRSQKRVATAINSEVEEQDDLLIDLGERADDTGVNLTQQTENVREATRKASTCGYWIIILLLFIAIIVVAVW